MSDSEIKFKVFRLINGMKYLYEEHINGFKEYVYHVSNIEKNEYNDKLIEKVLEIYFNKD